MRSDDDLRNRLFAALSILSVSSQTKCFQLWNAMLSVRNGSTKFQTCTSSRNNQLALLLLLALGLQCRVAHHPVVVTMDSACIGVGG
ncbi:hypothetical protein F442_17467 [Phytophthora nicotianae P10297]|uniref:Uncharacterized protein n=3 Tax=Phytophthora nicotianae TaxID=4792 RepID=W2QZN4_PHYN3|nr:hypothetical protein PPTG_21553 [Phytophthora nicotianae INRA-310]ETL83122.1 hypothetical protein L917_16872 [Phytophthora nicotianae]ETM36329.1 hypothetical protein L914_16951 [Phytophthora nicotianae]ETN18441.1 hypothetical protein PPTG_21553 [Phytophthora nicotianae INRA-310]ETP34165.1 hypothetical protein F442_17467 [Phytophthora nicotianae P10297]